MPTTKAAPSSKPPSKHHYVRINGPAGMRVYATNLALRELSPLLLQDSITEALNKSRKKTAVTAHFTAGRGKAFTVRVDPDRSETHVQMAKEA